MYEGTVVGQDNGCDGFSGGFWFGCRNDATVHLLDLVVEFGRNWVCDKINDQFSKGLVSSIIPLDFGGVKFRTIVRVACYGDFLSDLDSFVTVSSQSLACDDLANGGTFTSIVAV